MELRVDEGHFLGLALSNFKAVAQHGREMEAYLLFKILEICVIGFEDYLGDGS